MKLLKEEFEIHETLNTKLFDEDHILRKDVRNTLMKIADMFVESMQEDQVPLKVYDYWLVGSNAAYNYTQTSDIDIHIIVDMDMGVNPYILRLLYDYIKSSFNDKYDIKVKGHEVELYLEDINTSAVTNGIYSLKQNKWIKVPTQEEPKKINIEDSQLYKDAYKKYQELKDDEVEKFIDDMYVMRKISLANDGEFGEGNLVFKEFRNKGYLDELKDRKYAYRSKELTLEKLEESESKYPKKANWIRLNDRFLYKGKEYIVTSTLSTEKSRLDRDLEITQLLPDGSYGQPLRIKYTDLRKAYTTGDAVTIGTMSKNSENSPLIKPTIKTNTISKEIAPSDATNNIGDN